MSLPVLIFAAAAGFVTWTTWRSLRRAQGPEERTLVVRGVVMFWLLAALFAAALVFLPNKGRVLALIPIVLIGGAAANAYRASRRQLREKTEVARRFTAAKRVN